MNRVLAIILAASALAQASNIAKAAESTAMSYGGIEQACRSRYTNEFAKGLCWGYVAGLVDANIGFLNRSGRRVLCVVAGGDKDKIVDRVFSYVDAPKDKNSGADVFLTLAILKAFTCDRQ